MLGYVMSVSKAKNVLRKYQFPSIFSGLQIYTVTFVFGANVTPAAYMSATLVFSVLTYMYPLYVRQQWALKAASM